MGGRRHGWRQGVRAAVACVLHASYPIPLPSYPPTHPPAYFLVSGNLIRNGGTTGFAAGQSTGFEFMTSPWLQYEAYDIRVGAGSHAVAGWLDAGCAAPPALSPPASVHAAVLRRPRAPLPRSA